MDNTDQKISDVQMDRLASAVAARISASARTARLARSVANVPRLAEAELANAPRVASFSQIRRLASAVGQHLAARQDDSLQRLASAVGERLAASERTAPLASEAARHFAPRQVNIVASEAMKRLRTSD